MHLNQRVLMIPTSKCKTIDCRKHIINRCSRRELEKSNENEINEQVDNDNLRCIL